MYIECKKDFIILSKEFKLGFKYPVTNIQNGIIYYQCLITNYSGQISIPFLQQKNEYLELKKEFLCNCWVAPQIFFDSLICPKCHELINKIDI